MFYFTIRVGLLFTFPSRYSSLSLIQEYLALRGGPRRFTQDFTCLMLLGLELRQSLFQLLDYYHLGCRIQPLASFDITLTILLPHNPIPQDGLGCSRFARHYSGNRVCFLFL